MLKSNDSLIKRLHLFSRGLPSAYKILSALIIYSIFISAISSLLIGYKNSLVSNTPIDPLLIATNSILMGLIVIILPTLLTILSIKLLKRNIRIKHLLIITSVGALIYSIFIILASSFYYITTNYLLAGSVIIVGNASIFGLWFFISRIVIGVRRKALLYSAIQPIINILIYVAASSIIFVFIAPLWLLLVKLVVGLLIFAIISYIILYIIDKPIKGRLNFSGIDAFASVVQSWLFDVDIKLSNQAGYKMDVPTHTIILKKDNLPKALFYIPEIHYGPVGNIGGSNFPYLLNDYITKKYKMHAFILHSTVNEDSNPISSSELNIIKKDIDEGIKNAKKLNIKSINYLEGIYNTAKVSILNLDGVDIATFSRAPKVTEDFNIASSKIIKELLNRKNADLVTVELHNSRYESASKDELDGIKPNTPFIYEYIKAIKNMKKIKEAKELVVGVSSVNFYNKIGRPIDLAPGPLSTLYIKIGSFKKIMLLFNANNFLPAFRNSIIKYIKEKHNIDAEVLTTDTHYVNSLNRTASNVLGRVTTISMIAPYIDEAVKEALKDASVVDVYYRKNILKNFRVWGLDLKNNITNILNYVFNLAKIIVPMLLIGGFIIATLIISII
ncbi:MAG: DUF2070 family protein [Candidatus Micrarchaeia archaeon]